ncbi:hypothetical protein SRHO_G00333800 [Serrasalmus rhombeus]
MNRLSVKGKFTATLTGRRQNNSSLQDVYVVSGLKSGLFGRTASVALGLVARIDATFCPKTVTEQFPQLFSGLGRMEGKYKIELKPDAKPYSLSTPRRIPLPLMSKVKKELKRMEDLGVISRVEQPTDWCAGMVPVPKANNEVCICADLTLSQLNHSVQREKHLLPSVEHTLGQLEGAKVFSKMDANSGFCQISEDSRLLTTFITPFGRYCYNRLCFGISSAPEHYQHRMSRILEGLEGVVCQMDDVLVYGETQECHDERLWKVLKRLEENGVTLKAEKCEFSRDSVKFLGQIIDAEGVRTDPNKVKAVTAMEDPKDVSGVRCFLGMTNHLGKYIPQLAAKTQPLRDLRERNTWTWGHAQQQAFDSIKKRLWEVLGTDLFEWNIHQYLLVVDYFSRYVEVAKLSNTTSAAIINHLKSIFSRHGIPSTVRSDNGLQFSSDLFSQFAKEWTFEHITSSPRFPQSNREAERTVRTVKRLLQKELDPYLALMAYRATPLSNGHSPAELLMGRRIRKTLPTIPSSLQPEWTDLGRLRREEKENRRKQQLSYNRRHNTYPLPHLRAGDHVWVSDTKERGTS